MEGLKLIADYNRSSSLNIEPLEDKKVYVSIYQRDEEYFYHLNKDQAKQIVEHLTKVFEL